MTKTVVRIPFALPDITDREIDAVTQTMRSGWLTTGPNAAAFETEFVASLGQQPGDGYIQGIAVNSATAGLHLALEALGITAGDEVLVPDWTFTATAEVVRYLGAHPIMVDVEPDTLHIDLVDAEKKITAKTKAIMPMHYAGLPVSRNLVGHFAKAFNLKIVEDAAHAYPVLNEGIPVGLGESDAVVFSFYATKTITTGEGGMVLTKDPDVAKRIKTMRLHGISRDVFDRYRSTAPSWHYEVVAPGFKYNLPDTAAAMGRVQVERAQQMSQRRNEIAEMYAEAFIGLPLELPPTPIAPDTGHCWYLYTVKLFEAGRRDRFIEEMAERGVGCSVHFIPLHLHPYWRDTYQLKADHFPVADAQYHRSVSLPIFSAMTDDQVHSVIEATWSCLG